MEVVAVVGERDFRQSLCGKVNYDFKSSNAARTAAITKAEKEQSLPLIAFSTSSTTSLGNLIVLLTVGGFSGIINLLIYYPSVSIAFVLHLAYGKISKKYALQMQCIFDKMVPEMILWQNFVWIAGINLTKRMIPNGDAYFRGKRSRVKNVGNARAKGRQIGRPQVSKEDIPAAFLRHYPAHKNGQLNISELARVCDISRTTAYKYKSLLEKQQTGN